MRKSHAGPVLNILLALGLWFLFPDTARAENFQVSTVGDLRAALTAASINGENDTIILAEGVYSVAADGKGRLSYVPLGSESLVLIGAGQDATILDGEQIEQVLAVSGGARFEISDLTIRNGLAAGERQGGGLFVQNSDVAVSRVRFEGNLATWSYETLLGQFGGALGANLPGHSLTISDSRFVDNYGVGCALAVRQARARVTIVNSIFLERSCDQAVIYTNIYQEWDIRNSMILAPGLTNPESSGIWLIRVSRMDLANVTIVGTRAAIQSQETSQMTARNTILRGAVLDLDGSSELTAYVRNSAVRPDRINPAVNTLMIDNLADEFLGMRVDLQAGTVMIESGAPIIDRGIVETGDLEAMDLNGQPRIMGPRPDIGAYESPAHASLAALPDADGLGAVGVSAALWDAEAGRQFSHVLEGLGGAELAVVPLTPESVKAQVAVGDLNDNGTDDLAVLTVDAEGLVEVKIKDGLTGALISKMPFEADYHPLWLRVVPDTGSDGSVDLAVLGINSEGRPRAQVRDALSGALVSKVYFETAYVPFGFEVIEDLDGNTFPELAVLGVDAEGRVRAQVKDVVSGQRVSMVYFDKRYVPSHAVGVDTDGNGASDALAVLGENAEGIVRVQVKDVATASPLGIVRFESGYEPHALVSVPDVNLSGSPELAVLQTDAEGRVRVQVKDAVTGQAVSVIGFAGEHEPRDLVVVPDVNGNQHSELAYLGEGPVGTYLLQIKDVVTGRGVAVREIQ